MTKLPRDFYVRKFLNRPKFHSTAMVLGGVQVRLESFRKSKPAQVAMEADLTLSDCDRQITLDFHLWVDADLAAVANARHKSRVLRESVNGFLNAVDVALDLIEADRIEAAEDA